MITNDFCQTRAWSLYQNYFNSTFTKAEKLTKISFFSYLLFLLETPYNNIGQSQENILLSPSLVTSTKEQLQGSFNTILMKPKLML